MLEQRLETQSANQSIGSTIPADHPGMTLEVSDTKRMEFPVTYFLDPDGFQPMHSDQLNSGTSVPLDILGVLQSRTAMHSICGTYLLSAQSWLPIVSKKRLSEKVERFSEVTDAGFALLLLSMKLVCEIPPEQEHAALSSLYSMTKRFYSRVEGSCAISLQLLQSAILIAVYEIGHGIYPAGYLSVSHAARLGIMMGLHDRKHAPQLFKGKDTWTEFEEERRTWWAVILIER